MGKVALPPDLTEEETLIVSMEYGQVVIQLMNGESYLIDDVVSARRYLQRALNDDRFCLFVNRILDTCANFAVCQVIPAERRAFTIEADTRRTEHDLLRLAKRMKIP